MQNEYSKEEAEDIIDSLLEKYRKGEDMTEVCRDKIVNERIAIDLAATAETMISVVRQNNSPGQQFLVSEEIRLITELKTRIEERFAEIVISSKIIRK